MAYLHSQVSPLKIGKRVEHKGKIFKIINHEKPNPNFARHYLIQSYNDGRILKVFRHEIFEVHPDQPFSNDCEPNTTRASSTAAVGSGEIFSSLTTKTIFNLSPSQSQSDNELSQMDLSDLNVDKLSQSDNDMMEMEIPEEGINLESNNIRISINDPAPNTACRFKSAPSAETLDSIAMARTEPTTNKQTSWGVKLFRGWLSENSFSTEFELLNPEALNERLRVFYASLQTKKGTEYSKSSLIGIRAALSRHLTSPPFNRKLSLMKDREFMTSNHVLSGIVKILKRDGKDVTVHKKAVADGDIDKLYSSGVFALDNPVTLQNKVFWDIMINFGRRGQEGLHLLRKNSYAKFIDDRGIPYYTMTYNESNKTHHGLDARENSQDQRMYANTQNPSMCPVESLDLYLSKLSDRCESFFQQPLQYPKQHVWFAAQPLGKNKLAGMMAKISSDANLSKRYINHCIKATVATGLKRAGIDLLSIMSVTGHRNVKSLDSYIEGPSDNDRRKLSNTIQNFGSERQTTLVPVSDTASVAVHAVSDSVPLAQVTGSVATVGQNVATIAQRSSQISSSVTRNPFSDMNIL